MARLFLYFCPVTSQEETSQETDSPICKLPSFTRRERIKRMNCALEKEFLECYTDVCLFLYPSVHLGLFELMGSRHRWPSFSVCPVENWQEWNSRPHRPEATNGPEMNRADNCSRPILNHTSPLKPNRRTMSKAILLPTLKRLPAGYWALETNFVWELFPS